MGFWVHRRFWLLWPPVLVHVARWGPYSLHGLVQVCAELDMYHTDPAQHFFLWYVKIRRRSVTICEFLRAPKKLLTLSVHVFRKKKKNSGKSGRKKKRAKTNQEDDEIYSEDKTFFDKNGPNYKTLTQTPRSSDTINQPLASTPVFAENLIG